jgi:hypothetical protein
MPLPPGTKYRYKKGTHIRLAFLNGKLIETKNMKSGATHTPAEFKADKKRAAGKRKKARATKKKARGGK